MSAIGRIVYGVGPQTVEGAQISSRESPVTKGRVMFALVVLLFSANGYGAAVESVSADRVHIGVYTPTAEYGYVVTPDDCYLDAVYQY